MSEQKEGDFVEIEGFIYVSKKGSIRATKTRCGVKDDEIRAGIRVKIPAALFDKDALTIQVEIPEAVQRNIEASVDDTKTGTW